MFTFTPLNNSVGIADIALTIDELHDLRDTVQTALNYNPGSKEFAQAMEPARSQLGAAWDPWMLELQNIHTDGECEQNINFMFEDWISSWRISDFIDLVWTVARVSRVWDEPNERKEAEQ